MKSYNIGILGGDGIGPEVMREGLKVLEAVADIEGFKYDLIEYPYDSEHYIKTKELVPDSVIDEWRTLDAFFLGAIGDLMWNRASWSGRSSRGSGSVWTSTSTFGRSSSTRSTSARLRAKARGHRFHGLRENTEGSYSGIGGHLKKGTPDEVASVNGSTRARAASAASRYAFEIARKRAEEKGSDHKPKVTLVDKANAIRPQDIWTRAFAEVAKDYPGCDQDHAYVDAAACG